VTPQTAAAIGPGTGNFYKGLDRPSFTPLVDHRGLFHLPTLLLPAVLRLPALLEMASVQKMGKFGRVKCLCWSDFQHQFVQEALSGDGYVTVSIRPSIVRKSRWVGSSGSVIRQTL